MLKKRHFLDGVALPAAALLLTSLAAQQVHAQEAAPQDTATIEEIVVTAQHRTEHLQDVPISVQVLSGQTIATQNINSLNTLVQLAPSVHISGTGGGGRANELFIRGVGSGNNQSFDQSVGMFIDDIYHGRSRTSGSTFLDLERVEILKGPQSTFFGNNAIAGAFNIITRKPGEKFEANARALYGQDGQYALEGAAGGPVSDTLGLRIAATFNGLDGWLKNSVTGAKSPNEDNAAGRVTLVYRPDDAFDATLKLEAARKKNAGAWGAQVENCPAPAPFVPDGSCAARIAQGLPSGLDNDIVTNSPGDGAKLTTREGLLTMNYRLAGHVLTSVTGYYDYRSKLRIDGDFTPLTLLHINAPERYRQFSQEIRLASPAGQTFEYMVGGYFQSGRLRFSQDFSYNFLNGPIAAPGSPFAALVPYLPIGQTTAYHQDETSYAAFGSLTWNVTDRLRLSGGLRGTQVEKDYDQQVFFGTATASYGGVNPLPAALQPLAAKLGIGAPASFVGRRKDHAWLPSAKAQYDLTPDAMIYASYARGFKSGGFNGTDNTGVQANLPFAPEHVDAYEAGLKSELFNRRLQFNVAAFLSDYKDLQVTTNVTATGNIQSLVRNAAAVRPQGVEVETQWAVTRDLRLSAALTYLDAHYRNYPNANLTILQTFCRKTYVAPACSGLPNPVPASQDLSGRPTQYAPEWGGNITGSYGVDVGSSLRLSGEVSAIFSSDYYLTNVDDPMVHQDGYVKFDARLGIATRDGRWALDLIGKNLNDRTIRTFAQPLPTSTGATYAQKQQPRNFALQLRYNW